MRVAANRPPQDHRPLTSSGEPEGVAVQERNTAATLGYLDVAPEGRLIQRIEVSGAVHEAHRGQCRGEVEQARVVSWIRTSPARIHVLSPFGSKRFSLLKTVAAVSRGAAVKSLGQT